MGHEGWRGLSRALASDGVLRTPLVDRPIAGNELGRLNDVQREAAPDLVWQLLDWSSRGDIVIIEWQCTRQVGGKRFDWRGVDKFRLRDGKIAEERVYMDTALLRAALRRRPGADQAGRRPGRCVRAAVRALKLRLAGSGKKRGRIGYRLMLPRS